MGSIRTVENLAKPMKMSVSTLQLPSSRLNIGATYLNNTDASGLVFNPAVNGNSLFSATSQASIRFTVPIAEWAGSGTQFIW